MSNSQQKTPAGVTLRPWFRHAMDVNVYLTPELEKPFNAFFTESRPVVELRPLYYLKTVAAGRLFVALWGGRYPVHEYGYEVPCLVLERAGASSYIAVESLAAAYEVGGGDFFAAARIFGEIAKEMYLDEEAGTLSFILDKFADGIFSEKVFK